MTHKKGRRKNTKRKGKQKTKIQISHIHTAPKSTSESQAQITYLLTAPEPARGPLAAEIVSLVWGTPANFNGFGVLAALLHCILVVDVSQTLRR